MASDCPVSTLKGIYEKSCFFVDVYHAWRLRSGVVHGMAPMAADLPPPVVCGQVPHTARWLLAAGGCRSTRCNGGADWASSVASPSQCSLEETFSVDASHFPKFRIHPNPPDHRVPDCIPLVTPRAIPIPTSDRLSSQLQPGISSLQPNPTSNHSSQTSKPPCVKLCTLTLLRHPHLWCITSRPPL